MRVENLAEPFVIVPLDRWSRITEKGLRFALKISDQVQAVHVDAEDCCDEVRQMWQRNVAEPLRESGRVAPELIILSSPYRFVITPLVEHILKVEHDHPDRQIAVLVPKLRCQALDVHTGELRWSFHTIPNPGEFAYDTWPPQCVEDLCGCKQLGWHVARCYAWDYICAD